GSRHEEPALAEEAPAVANGRAVVGDWSVPDVLIVDVGRAVIHPVCRDDRPGVESVASAVQGDGVLGVDHPGHVDATADVDVAGHDEPAAKVYTPVETDRGDIRQRSAGREDALVGRVHEDEAVCWRDVPGRRTLDVEPVRVS